MEGFLGLKQCENTMGLELEGESLRDHLIPPIQPHAPATVLEEQQTHKESGWSLPEFEQQV